MENNAVPASTIMSKNVPDLIARLGEQKQTNDIEDCASRVTDIFPDVTNS